MKIKALIVIALLFAACTQDPQKVRRQAAECAGSGDHECAEKKYRWLLEKNPNDVFLQANLAFALTELNKHDGAIALYQKLIDEGEGTYDLFAQFASSLQAVGREDEAILWNYRTLDIVPKLVDVRGTLARLLVKKNRHYEALTLLASFDEFLESRGRSPYFKGQRIAIAASLPASSLASNTALMSPKLDEHFYTVVFGKDTLPLTFLVDTGASHTTLSRAVLKDLGVAVPKDAKKLTLQLADQRKVSGEQFVLPSLQVGPHTLQNIKVIVCDNCASLLGQTTLERFDLVTSKVDGVEFLSMKLRQ
jgi:tetratricopeptide (TPR) repeat protein